MSHSFVTPRSMISSMSVNSFRQAVNLDEPAPEIGVIRDLMAQSVSLFAPEQMQFMLSSLCTE